MNQHKTTTPKAFHKLLQSNACLTPTTIQANIQKDEPMKVTVINSGVKPKTLIKPGALEKPIVLNNSPWSLLVCLSGNSFVPTMKIRNAQKYQLAKDIKGPKRKFDAP